MELSDPPPTPSAPPALPSLPVGVTLLEGAQRIVNTDSTSRPRFSDPPSGLAARRRGPVVAVVGCAVVALLAVLALLLGGLVGAWLGLG